ncbi:hypothetical protein HMPREF3159_16200 [Brachybacterium sp. HMSC06H03]|uniref:methylated-DNA--[protein]-cysteine S-methyltransferase n=1 Tax=Brachybacterium sp. HMSC06H03 TaxID=1581127 RepID=UPI0008A46479|nr:hypothetical protein HMPREF3159_16200 [Brachybacterium sp. HMSC06H03]
MPHRRGEHFAVRQDVAWEEFDLPLRTGGDDFSDLVWALLQEIPYGETTTCGALAAQLGSRGHAQRVGRNPLSGVVPCHRVVGADVSLTGSAGGFERKRTLLEPRSPPSAAPSDCSERRGEAHDRF